MIDHDCIVCHAPSPSASCHWPRTRRYGTATVPMCTSCHNAQHSGDKWVIERLIDRAPGYWRSVGEWEMNVEAYERWCSKRRFQRVFDWVR